MWPFGKESEENKRKRESQEATVKALQNGELPPIAQKRIEAQQKLDHKFFTSDLSTREHILCREAGFEAVSQVMGSCFYKVGYRGYYAKRWTGTDELSDLTHAQSQARHLAIHRMEQEAELLGASGVIGVRLTARGYDWSSGLMEFTAFGTAIRIPGWRSGTKPFSSQLSAQEFWQLFRSGYRPVGIAFGICCYYIYTNPQAMKQMFNWWGGSKPNQEVDHYTSCFLNARHRAMKRLQAEIHNSGAEGCVGASVDYELEQIEYDDSSVYRDVLLNFTASGTTIVKDNNIPTVEPKPGTLLCLDLAGNKKIIGANNLLEDGTLQEMPPELRLLLESNNNISPEMIALMKKRFET